MQFIAPDLVVLDPLQAVAADYCHHQPRRADFSLQAPYQASLKNRNGIVRIPEASGSAADAAAGQGQGATLAVAAVGNEGTSNGGRRKRPRSSSYQPNSREQEAAARHAEYAPVVTAAAAAVKQWLQASGARMVHEALHAVAPSAHAATAAPQADEAQQQHNAKHDQQPELQEGKRPHNPASSTAACDAGQGSADEGCLSEAEPDFAAMFELRHVLKPKFQFATAAASSASVGQQQASLAVETAGQRSRRAQDVRSAPRNLFNQLVDCCPPAGSVQAHQTEGSWRDGGDGCGDCSRRCERLALAGSHPVVLPPGSRFLMSDARQLQPLLEDAAARGGYHCILLDPPWENKSAKRSACYPTLPSRNLLAMPLRQLMHADGCLVALWVTNRERHRRFIDAELLPGWGLHHIATWHWLKVTDGGEPVGRLDIQHRRPYESLLLCWPAHLPPPASIPQTADVAAAAAPAAAAGPRAAGSEAGDTRGFHLLQGRPLVIAAVPPAAHSRKPHLGPLLLPLLPPKARCLEMFARELHSGWTSWGNEALKFQSASCFQRRQ